MKKIVLIQKRVFSETGILQNVCVLKRIIQNHRVFIKSCVLIFKRVFEQNRVNSKTYNEESSCVYQIVWFELKTCVLVHKYVCFLSH